MYYKNKIIIQLFSILLGIVTASFILFPERLSFITISFNGFLLAIIFSIHLVFHGGRRTSFGIFHRLNHIFKIRLALFPLICFFAPYLFVVLGVHVFLLDNLEQIHQYFIQKFPFVRNLISGGVIAYLCGYYLRFTKTLNIFLCIVCVTIFIISIVDLTHLFLIEPTWLVTYINDFKLAYTWASYAQPIIYGIALIIAGIGLLYFYYMIINTNYNFKRLKKSLLLIVIFMFLIISINSIILGSRSIWLGFIIAIFTFFLVNKKYGHAVFVSLFYGILFLIVTNFFDLSLANIYSDSQLLKMHNNNPLSDSGIEKFFTDLLNERFIFIMSGLNMWLNNPFFGVGIENFSIYSRDYTPNAMLDKLVIDELYWQPHNMFVKLLAESGIIGFGGFILMLGWIIIQSFKQYCFGNQKQRARIAVGIATLLPLFSIAMLHDVHDERIWWCALGLLLASTNGSYKT